LLPGGETLDVGNDLLVDASLLADSLLLDSLLAESFVVAGPLTGEASLPVVAVSLLGGTELNAGEVLLGTGAVEVPDPGGLTAGVADELAPPGAWLMASVATAANAASRTSRRIFLIIVVIFHSSYRVHKRSAMHLFFLVSSEVQFVRLSRLMHPHSYSRAAT
jgi:hypothetical protein